MAPGGSEANRAATQRRPLPSFGESVVLLSMMMSLAALSIDAMLPALPQIGADLGIGNPNDRQLVVSLIFVGLAGVAAVSLLIVRWTERG